MSQQKTRDWLKKFEAWYEKDAAVYPERRTLEGWATHIETRTANLRKALLRHEEWSEIRSAILELMIAGYRLLGQYQKASKKAETGSSEQASPKEKK